MIFRVGWLPLVVGEQSTAAVDIGFKSAEASVYSRGRFWSTFGPSIQSAGFFQVLPAFDKLKETCFAGYHPAQALCSFTDWPNFLFSSVHWFVISYNESRRMQLSSTLDSDSVAVGFNLE